MVKLNGPSFFGLVIGAKQMQKTVKVRVARTRMHPVVMKEVTWHKTFLVHDEKEKCVVGDWVRMDFCLKRSKNKNFEIGEIVSPAMRHTDPTSSVSYSQASINSFSHRSAIEKRDQDLRRKQFQTEDLVKKLNSDIVFQSNLESDERVDNIRRLRQQRLRAEEEAARAALNESLRLKEDRKRRSLLEQEAVRNYEAAINAQLREEKMRQSIRKNSVELQELEAKLRAAYMNKERALQIQEKQLHLQREKVLEDERNQEVSKKLDQDNRKAVEQEREAYERSLAYQEALQSQLIELEHKKMAEYEQFLREKEMVDAIVSKIIAEDEKEMARRMEKQKETKQFIEDYLHDREEWRIEEQKRQAAENEKIEAYARLQSQRQEQIKEKQRSMDEEKNQIYDRLANEMARQEREKAELEQLRIDLYQEEEEERARQRDQQILQTRIRKRLELIDAYQMQVEDKRRRLEKQQAEEGEFRRKMMEKFAHDEHLEQMNAQRRRMKQIEHKRAVDALVEERRRLLQEEYERQRAEELKEHTIEQYRQQVIEQERQRLLLEHASKLLGYLPKGVLRDSNDLALFDEDFRTKFERLGVENGEDTEHL